MHFWIFCSEIKFFWADFKTAARSPPRSFYFKLNKKGEEDLADRWTRALRPAQ